jgi:hypothetical protein
LKVNIGKDKSEIFMSIRTPQKLCLKYIGSKIEVYIKKNDNEVVYIYTVCKQVIKHK